MKVQRKSTLELTFAEVVAQLALARPKSAVCIVMDYWLDPQASGPCRRLEFKIFDNQTREQFVGSTLQEACLQFLAMTEDEKLRIRPDWRRQDAAEQAYEEARACHPVAQVTGPPASP